MNERIREQHHYLRKCQLPSGTFRLSPASNIINPYFTNLGLLALVELGDCGPVKEHLAWYVQHLSADGYVNDYRLVHDREQDAGSADSEDSYHATFFILLLAYLKQSDDLAWLPSMRDSLARIFRALVNLQRQDGLTWAKRSYKVKYLMDNCEVYQGLLDAAAVFSLLRDAELATEAKNRAAYCRAGIQGLYRPAKQTYAIFNKTYPVWSKWYPDATSQVFPIVYRLIAPDSTTALHLYRQLTSYFPRFEFFETGDSYPWMFMGQSAAQMGDWERVQRMLDQADRMFVQGPLKAYWLFHESGQYIQLALRMQTGANITS